MFSSNIAPCYLQNIFALYNKKNASIPPCGTANDDYVRKNRCVLRKASAEKNIFLIFHCKTKNLRKLVRRQLFSLRYVSLVTQGKRLRERQREQFLTRSNISPLDPIVLAIFSLGNLGGGGLAFEAFLNSLHRSRETKLRLDRVD